MVNEHALTVSLEEFGLSKYEAQAYVTLIAKGTISAGELAYYSEIPRTKIYPTLLKLENKKLTIISKLYLQVGVTVVTTLIVTMPSNTKSRTTK